VGVIIDTAALGSDLHVQKLIVEDHFCFGSIQDDIENWALRLSACARKIVTLLLPSPSPVVSRQ